MKQPWNDLSRGATHWIDGPDEEAKNIDLHPLMSGQRPEDEGLFIAQHHYWQQVMTEAAQKEGEE
jgi:benzoate/toluate 1,2-dioxygenase alpha subunit